MKAVVKVGTAPGAEVRDMPTPTIGDGDVLIKVKAAAICGSDVHIYQSSASLMGMISLPRIFGHEVCGEVVSLGKAVTQLKVGDLVAVETHIFCGNCYQCQTGRRHVCQSVIIYGLQMDGAFAEYARVPEAVCWKLSKDTPPDLGAILEPLGVALHGVLAGDINGKAVAIFGCGPIGIFAVQMALALGARQVFASEVSPARLSLVRECTSGAITFNPREIDPMALIMEETDGQGVEVALDYSGNHDALRSAFKVLRPGGRVSLVGVPSAVVNFDLYQDIMLKEAQISGISGRLIWQSWWHVHELLKSEKINPLPVITHRFPLEDFVTAIKLAATGSTGKVILYP